jgi:hypothetical protein
VRNFPRKFCGRRFYAKRGKKVKRNIIFKENGKNMIKNSLKNLIHTYISYVSSCPFRIRFKQNIGDPGNRPHPLNT